MNAVRRFEEFIKEGVVKVQAPDKSRAKFLITESENSYKLLSELMQKIKVEDHSANMFVKSCYDILMELIRARMLLDGYNASGYGAHEAEVAYLRILRYSETEKLGF